MNGLNDNQKLSDTWMLFDSGKASRIEALVYPQRPESNRPVDVFIVTEVPSSVLWSAQRGANALYDTLLKHGKKIPPFVVGFDLSATAPVTGESGGLAFAISLAKQLLVQDPGAVAATGVVESIHGDGPITRVEGIAAKLKAAEEVLPEKGWFIYPRDNQPDIPREHLAQFEEKGLRHQSVSSIAGALEKLFCLNKISPVTASDTQVTQPVPFSNSKSGRNLKRQPSGPFKLGVLFGVICLLAGALTAAVWVFDGKGSKTSHTSELTTEKPVIEEKIGVRNEGNLSETPGKNNGEEKAGDKYLKNSREVSPESRVTSTDTVKFVGKSRLSRNLADQVSRKLSEILRNFEPENQDRVEIKGRLKIRKVIEELDNNSDEFYTNLTLAIGDFRYKSGSRIIEYPILTVTLEGPGRMEALLPAAPDQVIGRILEAIKENASNNQFPNNNQAAEFKKNPSSSSKGFE